MNAINGEKRPCPLCKTPDSKPFFKDKRDYFRCPTCYLVFVPPAQFVSPEKEKSIYDLHENSSDDPGYRQFLSRLFIPMAKRLPANSSGLDFGSGPGPTLSVMFEEAGHTMALYDPFYAPQPKTLQQSYNFISASEVVEHLHHPRRELERLWDCLKPQGILGIMTKRVIDREAFSRWHYKNDPTHVCFFSTTTFQWLANRWEAALVVPHNDVVLLIKNA